MEMNKQSKAILMNIAVLAALAFFYFKGTSLMVLLISGSICLVVLNLVLMISKPKVG